MIFMKKMAKKFKKNENYLSKAFTQSGSKKFFLHFRHNKKG